MSTPTRQWIATWLEWALLGFGLGCLGTFAYTTAEAHRFQQTQTASFERALVAAEPASAVDVDEQTNEISIGRGDLVGMLEVPRLNLSTPVLSGDDDATLARSVGHLPDTPLPWQEGNSAIAGHRDTLFRPLKDIAVGDEVVFRSLTGDLRYRVTQTLVVEPDDLSVLDATPDQASLTMITCFPFHYVGPAPQRFIVRAERLP